MKSKVTASTALALALAASTASAGVVISQELVNQTGARKIDQTLMVQGHKQKVITGDREIVTDLDAGKIYIITPKTRQFFQAKFPAIGMVAMNLMWEGSTVELKKTGVTHRVAGYACQDYTGAVVIARHNISVTKCVASDAPGAREFVEFQKAMAQKLKRLHLAPKGEIPDGVPVSSTITTTPTLFMPPHGFPPEQAAKLNEGLAKYKPTIRNTAISKIELKDLPADTFAVPSDYTRRQEQMIPPNLIMRRKHPVTPGSAPTASAAPAP